MTDIGTIEFGKQEFSPIEIILHLRDLSHTPASRAINRNNVANLPEYAIEKLTHAHL